MCRVHRSTLWVSSVVFAECKESRVLVSNMIRCSTGSEGGAGLEGRRCSDRLQGGRWKVCNESGEILRCLKESEHVMCLTHCIV
jgi:hypothetical protein